MRPFVNDSALDNKYGDDLKGIYVCKEAVSLKSLNAASNTNAKTSYVNIPKYLKEKLPLKNEF